MINLKGFDFSVEQIEKAINNKKLLQCSVNIWRECNFRCLYCLMNGGKSRKNELTSMEIKRVLREAHDLGAKTWYIAGDGEALLYPQRILELIDFCNSLGMWVVLATNGDLLTVELTKKLFARQISIITKFNSFNKGVFDFLVDSNSTFEKSGGVWIPRGVANLIKIGLNKFAPARAGIETVVTSINIGEIPDIYRFAIDNNLFCNIEAMLPIGRAKLHPELISSEKNLRQLYESLRGIAGIESCRACLSHYQGINCRQRIKYSFYSNSIGNVYNCFSQAPELNTHLNVRTTALKKILERRKVPEFNDCACMEFKRK